MSDCHYCAPDELCALHVMTERDGTKLVPEWTKQDERTVQLLRELSQRRELDPTELRELRRLRQKEINESIRRRNVR